jgi:hypothetical protein
MNERRSVMRKVVEVLFFEGCPNHHPALDLAREVVADVAPDALIEEVEVHDGEEAERLRFLGSPTIRVDGIDIDPEARARTSYAMSCRMYGASGVPPRELLEAALGGSSAP